MYIVYYLILRDAICNLTINSTFTFQDDQYQYEKLEDVRRQLKRGLLTFSIVMTVGILIYLTCRDGSYVPYDIGDKS